MILSRLKMFHCPKCNNVLLSKQGYFECSKEKCKYKIWKKQFDYVVAKLYAKKPVTNDEASNFEKLQNM